jgi:hypothetical protein
LPIKIAEVVHRNGRHGARINETILSYRALFAKSDSLLGAFQNKNPRSEKLAPGI